MVAAMVSDIDPHYAYPHSYGYLLQLWIPPTAMDTSYSYGYPYSNGYLLQLWLQLWLPPTALSVSYERACYLHWA